MKVEFNCTKCGKCCTGAIWSGVRLTPEDGKRLTDKFGPSAVLMFDNAKHRPRLKMIQKKPRQPAQCIMLADDGTCKAYDARPDQCRSFPFWAGLWATPGAWKTANCEGLKVEEQ